MRLLLRPLDTTLDLSDVGQILIQPRAIPGREAALEMLEIVDDEIEQAAVRAHASQPLFQRSATAKQTLEHDSWIDLHRQRCRRRLPIQRVHVGAAVTRITGADQTAEVFGGHFERWERGVLPD